MLNLEKENRIIPLTGCLQSISCYRFHPFGVPSALNGLCPGATPVFQTTTDFPGAWAVTHLQSSVSVPSKRWFLHSSVTSWAPCNSILKIAVAFLDHKFHMATVNYRTIDNGTLGSNRKEKLMVWLDFSSNFATFGHKNGFKI